MDNDYQIIMFACIKWGYSAADLAGVSRMKYTTSVKIIKLKCTGRIDVKHLLFAIKSGADVIVMDDHKRGFLRGVIEGREEDIPAEFKSKLITYLKEKAGINAELVYEKNENIAAGFRVTVEDLQLDATLDNQLSKLKESVLS